MNACFRLVNLCLMHCTVGQTKKKDNRRIFEQVLMTTFSENVYCVVFNLEKSLEIVEKFLEILYCLKLKDIL